MAGRVFQFRKYRYFQLRLFGKSVAKFSTEKEISKYFLTTPIFYVNAEPHIGHLYTAVIGDAIARYQKIKNPSTSVRFMVGTDEHGLKVSKAAEVQNIDVKKFCDNVSQKYRFLFDEFHIEWDDFIRTTEDRHCQTVSSLWEKIKSKNLIYKDKYSGWYCVADETFVSEDLLVEGNSHDHRYTRDGKKPVYFTSEINYKFKLSKFQDSLLHWLKSDIVKPKLFQDILYKMILDGEVLKDISISRPTERVSWGILTPGDDTQTVYVWFDALASYLCSNGYPDSQFKWPPDVQIIGKDILKFHGIYWPAFLMAVDLEPPKYIFCHSHWLKDKEKISKSKQNIIDPMVEAKKYTNDGFRYFLLREGVPQNDGNYTKEKISAILNSEIGNTLGNLLCRCTGLKVNKNQIFPSLLIKDSQKYGDQHSENLMNSLIELPDLVQNHFDNFHFYKGIDAIIASLHITNKFFDSQKPWTLCKNKENESHLNFVLNLTMESLRICGILLQPIIPNIANNLLNKLSIDRNKRTLKDIKPFSWEASNNSTVAKLNPENVILLPKIMEVDRLSSHG